MIPFARTLSQLCLQQIVTLLGFEPAWATVTSYAFPEAVCTWNGPAQTRGLWARGSWFALSRAPDGPELQVPLVTNTFHHPPQAQPRAVWKLQAVHRSYWRWKIIYTLGYICRGSVLESYHRFSRDQKPIAHELDFVHGLFLNRTWAKNTFLHFKRGRRRSERSKRRGGGGGGRYEDEGKTETIVAYKAKNTI